MKTYKRLHPDPDANGYLNNDLRRKTLDERVMAREQPPQEPFSMLMPPRVTGFNLRRKKWFDLSVDRISHVEWNKDAFESLAIDSKSRDLIEALVTNHVEPEYSADLIAGKGNGLILLLHGGPGTGKTLTAESVAEIAERPLYRVTCGDVGIKPEEVEKYLESVLHLGKIWNCVVLLDEADVFLEQRGLEDLNRNALVSAFLRVVEYFEGILILTTNRVGTFDEAFKSRIQLALHYPPLGEEQRRTIWEAFIQRLDGFDEDAVDVENLMGSLDVLQREKLNGRQIRNAITTARQYAKWKSEVLTYGHLKDVIEVSAKFDDYLENIHRGGLMQF
jgi:SpoVK/Ycf46/Vps4 family AAA+-type ATPase